MSDVGGGTHRATVAEAAEYLDLHWPTEEVGQPWWEAINPSRLNMGSVCRCVCGQLGARLAEHEGYELDGLGHILPDGGRRRWRSSGFHLLRVPLQVIRAGERHRDGETRELGFADLALAQKLAKRLGADPDGDDPILPDHLRDAFVGATPADWWREEIRARRTAAAG